MTLQLSARPIEEFYGAIVDTMPILVSGMKDGQQVDIERELMPISFLYDQRENGLEPFRTIMRDNYFFTSAGAAKNKEGNHKWDLRSPLLRDVEVVNAKNLSIGAAKISDEQYEAISGKRVKEVPRDEVVKLHGKGYVRKEGSDLFVPANGEVEEFHEFLNQGRINLSEYAGRVAEETSLRYKTAVDNVMNLYFDSSNHGSAVVRSVVVDRTDSLSYVNGNSNLLSLNGRLAGVAPEALDAFDNANGKAPTPRQQAQAVWEHLGSVDVRKSLTRKGLEDALRSSR
ncbi:hypothetical protein KKB44_01800 [Candidatus Micrarchaeota archaeon]|nr:hypothetical protein [Candidatus Micrarchaeota archaeon]MBU1623278.1 hypothetical protein [Nanoarchaeota archaeon]